MTGKEAINLSGRSETWLRNHQCSWCGQTLWLALTAGCGASGERCAPKNKNFGPDAMHRKFISEDQRRVELERASNRVWHEGR